MNATRMQHRQTTANAIVKELTVCRRHVSGVYGDWVAGLLESFNTGKTLDQILDWGDVPLAHAIKAQQIEQEARSLYPFNDVLGVVMTEMGQAGHAKNLGAFFTPYQVSYMMAEMSLQGIDFNDHPKGINVLEPCVGAGSMAIAVCEVMLQEYGQIGLDHLNLTVNDIDLASVHSATYQVMCAIAAAAPKQRLRNYVAMCGNTLMPTDCRLVYHVSGTATSDEVAHAQAVRELIRSA